MSQDQFRAWDQELRSLLGLAAAPVAITFADQPPAGVEQFNAEAPPPTADGRTGAVPAGCVFWIEAASRTFATLPADHGNCSVGSFTHGLKTFEEIAQNADVAALCELGWVTPEAITRVAAIGKKPGCIVYGPLREAPIPPSVVLLRLNAKQQMLLHDAWPELRFEGKPQCHIIPIAKERGEVAISVGCMLSRVRTGMSSNEVTCAIPAEKLPLLLERLQAARAADLAVAAYAAEDSRRFKPAAPTPTA